MNKFFKRLSVTMLILVLSIGFFASCGNNDESTVIDANVDGCFHKYSSTLNIKVGQWVADETMFPAGQNVSDNVMYDLMEEHFNINLKPKFTTKLGDTFFTQVGNLQALDDLPDITAMNVNILYDAIEAEQLVDLKPYIDKNASPTLKRILGARNGEYLKIATKDGKIYGLPKITDKFNTIPMIWVRKDWLLNVGLIGTIEEDYDMNTFADFENMLKAFKDNISTIENETGVSNCYPLAMYKTLHVPFTGIMNAFDAYPGIYLQENDEYIYGSLTEEVKLALQKLNEFQVKGYLKDGWAQQDTVNIAAESAMGRVGVFIDEFWASLASQIFGSMQTKFNDNGLENAEWAAYPVPSVSGGLIKPQITAQSSEYYTVRKGFSQPEALIIMMNAMCQKYSNDACENTEDETALEAFSQDFKELTESEEYASKMIYGWLPFFIDDPDKNETYMNNICSVINGETEESTLKGEEILYYNIITSEANTPAEKLAKWQWSMVYGPKGGIAIASKYTDFKYNAYAGAPTPAMVNYGSSLTAYENSSFVNMIVGTKSITSSTSGFFGTGNNAFVKSYNNQGGLEIIQEINNL